MYLVLMICGAIYTVAQIVGGIFFVFLGNEISQGRWAVWITLVGMNVFSGFFGYQCFRIGLFHIHSGRNAMMARWRYWFIAIVGAISFFGAVSSFIVNIDAANIAFLMGRLLGASLVAYIALHIGIRHLRKN